jgi:cytochrome c oxidase cbb3-type subunit IV
MEYIAGHSGIIVSLLFFTMFMGILLWAYWPGNKQRLQEHAMIPLKEDGHGG